VRGLLAGARGGVRSVVFCTALIGCVDWVTDTDTLQGTYAA
jgi:ascorbate-specific PTS system EIIC-type component UlaA